MNYGGVTGGQIGGVMGGQIHLCPILESISSFSLLLLVLYIINKNYYFVVNKHQIEFKESYSIAQVPKDF